MEAIKPFACPNEDCSMSFTNEDHLSVHQKKHILSLSLTPTTPYKTLYDQTPTPTRFFNALDSAELFQDFNAENPFDATFRRANSSNSGTPNFIIPESSSLIASLPDTSEVLNTPSITLPSEPATPIILKSEFLKIQKKKDHAIIQAENADSLPFSPKDQQQSLEKALEENLTTLATTAENAPSAEAAFNTTSILPSVQKVVTKSSVVQTPVITSVGNNVSKSTATCVPTAVVTKQVTNVAPTQISVVAEKPTEIKVVPQQQAAVVQSVCVTPMLQLIIRLPDGQTMPVQFPVMSTATAGATVAAVAQPIQTAQPLQQTQHAQPLQQSQPTQLLQQAQLQPVQPLQPVQSSSAAESSDSEIPAANILTKMRLKEVLKLNKKSLQILKKSPPRSQTKSKNLTAAELITEYGLSPPPSPVAAKPGHTGRRRRDTIDEVDDKRLRSLERNRAAATRCREKRKQWITALERKAEELSTTNVHLQEEVASLRKEVQSLKTLLMLHKDCPVTQQQQQKATNLEEHQETYTTVQYVTAEDFQCVPNIPNVSPTEQAEYMEVEASSVQSSSDLSLTSDSSEVSFKER